MMRVWTLVSILMASAVAAAACSGDDGETTSTTTSSVGGGGVGGSTVNTAVGGGGSEPAWLECLDGNGAEVTYSDVPEGECNLLNQGPCPDGYGCVVKQVGVSNNFTTACEPAMGLKDAGTACADANECGAGLRCIFGKCSGPCCPETHEPCNGGECSVQTNYGGLQVYYCTYLVSCELFGAETCEVGEACFPQFEEGYAACIPQVQNAVDEGETCISANGCQSYQLCLNGTCRWACMLSGTGLDPGLGGCEVGQSCTPINPGNIPDVGVCN